MAAQLEKMLSKYEMSNIEYYTKEKNMELCIQNLKGDLNYKSSLVNNNKSDIDL